MRKLLLLPIAILLLLWNVSAQQISVVLDSHTPTIEEESIEQRYKEALKQADQLLAPTTESKKRGINRIEIAQTVLNSSTTSNAFVYHTLKEVSKYPTADFYHTASQTLFPYRMGIFKRSHIKSVGKATKQVIVTYETANGSKITIHLTPNSEGSEGRLRNSYLQALSKFSLHLPKGVQPTHTMLQFKGVDYDTNGIQGNYQKGGELIARCSVYECGSWILGITETRESNEQQQILDNASEQLLQHLNPSHLVALQPFNLKSNLEFDKKNLQNNPTVGALWASAMKKLEWAETHISPRERAAGFPDLYLGMHIAAAEEYIAILSQKRLPNNSKERQFYHQIRQIQSAGFLPEFFMQHYDNLLLTTDGFELYPADYELWKEENGIRIAWKDKLYNIVYRNLNY